MREAVSAELMATDLADYLVEQGLPFREAHAVVGQVVRQALALGRPITDLNEQTLKAIHPLLNQDALVVFDPVQSLARRNLSGGSGPHAVAAQVQAAHAALAQRYVPGLGETMRSKRTSEP